MSIKNNILLRPLLTEKMTRLEEEQRKYAFEVHPKANKLEIKAAVENKFGVKVLNVATSNRVGKAKSTTIRSSGRVIRTEGRRAHWKRAIVTLAEGQRIDLFGAEGTT
ncbi:MAG: 50S ribosomal protein L23 [Candidatus Neomarinimicrobiota bacterium]